jgi:hypothetical protein
MKYFRVKYSDAIRFPAPVVLGPKRSLSKRLSSADSMHNRPDTRLFGLPTLLSQNKTCEIMKYLRVKTADSAIRCPTAAVDEPSKGCPNV